MRDRNYMLKEKIFNFNLFKRLLSRKSMDLVQIETDTSNELRRSVTSIQMIALSIGGTIGMLI